MLADGFQYNVDTGSPYKGGALWEPRGIWGLAWEDNSYLDEQGDTNTSENLWEYLFLQDMHYFLVFHEQSLKH
jgi:hypothetical protein